MRACNELGEGGIGEANGFESLEVRLKGVVDAGIDQERVSGYGGGCGRHQSHGI